MSLKKKLFRFIVPSVVSMWVFSLYSMVDGIFVSLGVGEHALAAVNLSLPYVNTLFSVGMLFAAGTSALISMALGEGDRERACRYFNQNLIVVGAVCILLSAVTLLNLESIALFLGGGAETLTYVKEYVGTIAPFALFFAVSYNLELQVKADGAPQVSTVGVVSCGLMNVVLDALFVLGFGWGVRGAALATGLAQVTSTVIFVLYFRFRRHRLEFGHFGWDLSIYRRSLPMGVPDALTELSNAIVIFAFNLVIIQVLGEEKVACYTIICYVNTMVLMTMSGIAQGMQPLVSFHYGAGERAVCRRLLRWSLLIAAVCSAALFVLTQVGSAAITGLFLARTSVLFPYTVSAMRKYAASFLLMGVNVVAAGYFTAIGFPRYALPISLGRGCVLLLGALYVTAYLIGGEALWFATALAEALCLGMSIFFLRRERMEQKN